VTAASPANRCASGKPYLPPRLRKVAAGTPVRYASSLIDKPS